MPLWCDRPACRRQGLVPALSRTRSAVGMSRPGAGSSPGWMRTMMFHVKLIPARPNSVLQSTSAGMAAIVIPAMHPQQSRSAGLPMALVWIECRLGWLFEHPQFRQSLSGSHRLEAQGLLSRVDESEVSNLHDTNSLPLCSAQHSSRGRVSRESHNADAAWAGPAGNYVSRET